MEEENKKEEKQKKEPVKAIEKDPEQENDSISETKKAEEKTKLKKQENREIPIEENKAQINLESKKEEIKEEKTESNNQKYQQVKVKRKSTIPIILITIIICLGIFLSVIFALLNISNEKILSGISIMQVDVSNLTPEEAKTKLEEIINEKLKEELNLKHDDYETSINATQLNSKFDIEKAINEAYNIGRESNIVVNNYKILWTKLFKENINIELYLDEEALNSKINDISAKIPGTVKQSNYYIEDENLIIVKGTEGITIKQSEFKKSITEELKQINKKYDIVQIPVETIQPENINIEKIRQEIYKEPQDAYVSKNPTKVHTHVDGVDFKISIEEAKKLLEEDKKEYTIPLKITTPKKTIKDLGEEAFPELLATYTTRYDPTNYNRSNNLTIAANKINGTIVMPTETFSYNKIVGARTIEAGYKLAGAYAGGKVVQDVGGGICQISSTLYNTALLANLEIVDRSNHQFLTGYVSAGRDATVSWGAIDFKFKNSRTYPIKVVSSAKNGICTISIYGIKEETEYEVSIQPKVLSYIPYSVKYIEDNSLAQGKEVVEQSGYNGCTSETYRILKLNGKVISKTLLSKDTYDPMQRIVKKGTKKVTTKNDNNQKTNTNQTMNNE